MDELEQKKLELEIKQLSMAFWKKPQWIAPASAIVLSSVGLIYLLASGYFDSSLRKLESEKARIAYENVKLDDRKHELIVEIEKKEKALNILNNNIRTYGAPMIYDYIKEDSLLSFVGFNFGTTNGYIYLYFATIVRELSPRPFRKSPTDSINVATNEPINYSIVLWSDSLVTLKIFNAEYYDRLLTEKTNTYIKATIVDHLSRGSEPIIIRN